MITAVVEVLMLGDSFAVKAQQIGPDSNLHF